jgi:hypothetical protein
VVTAPTASAATSTNETLTLYNDINNTGLSALAGGVQTLANSNVSVSVAPAVAAPGDELTITVGSTTISPFNGPAGTLAAGANRIDAIVEIDGRAYLIKGPGNPGCANANSPIFQPGWTISSAATGDSATAATGTGTVCSGTYGPASNNAGVLEVNPTTFAIIDANPATPAIDPTVIEAPGTTDTYPVVLRGIFSNSVSGTGSTGAYSDALNDPFDGTYSSLNPPSPLYAAPSYASPNTTLITNTKINLAAEAEFEVDARTVSVASVSGQSATNLGRSATSAVTTPGGTVPAQPGSTVTLDFNEAWSAGTTTVEFCDPTCVPAGSVSLTGGVDQTVSFALTVLDVTTATVGGELKITDSNGTKSKSLPFNLLGTRQIVFSPAATSKSVGSGSAFTVVGSNFDSGSWVRVYYSGVNYVGFAQASATGNVSVASTAPATAGTRSLLAQQYIPSAAPVTSAGTSIPGSDAVGPIGPLVLTVLDGECTVPAGGGSCDTFTTVLAEVKAGSLSQKALSAYVDTTGNNLNNTSKTTIQIYFNEAANGQDYNLDTDTNDWVNYTRTSTTVQNGVGNLNPIQVTDTRGTDTLWSLTANMANLTAGLETIGANNIYLSGLTCVDDRGTASASASAGAAASAGKTFFTTDSNGSLPNDMTLCTSTAADSDGGTSGGQWTVKGGIGVDVPAFQAVGNYSGVLTITLA